MAVQLFILRGIPDDEADEVREVLAAQGIDYYETPAGNWGMSMPALWLRDETQLAEAKALIAAYQNQRSENARREYQRRKEEGDLPTVLDLVRQKPGRVVVYLALIALCLYISISPFVNLGQ